MTCNDVPETFNQRQSVLGLMFVLTSSVVLYTKATAFGTSNERLDTRGHNLHTWPSGLSRLPLYQGSSGSRSQRDFDQDVLRQYLHVPTRYEAPNSWSSHFLHKITSEESPPPPPASDEAFTIDRAFNDWASPQTFQVSQALPNPLVIDNKWHVQFLIMSLM